MSNKKKIVLICQSEGSRGQNGKKKIYEIIVDGNCVITRWGKAEEDARQSKTEWFGSVYSATSFADSKKWDKLAKGYHIALVA